MNSSYNRFITLDFETANNKGYSACAVGITVIDNLVITEKSYFLIRPPEKYFIYTGVHGITADMVKDKPLFCDIWPEMKKYFRDIDFVAAHNSHFDKSVLRKCCEYYKLQFPEIKFRCSMKLARKYLSLQSYALNSVCDYYGIKLDHHYALSDSTACAEIMIRIMSR